MAEHWTRWADSEVAEAVCAKAPKEEGVILSDEPKGCPHCGRTLRLVWDVRIEVVETGQRPTEERGST
jgi:hypothetical protein